MVYYTVYYNYPQHVFDGYGPQPPQNPQVVQAQSEEEAEKKAYEQLPCDGEVVSVECEGETLF